MNIHELKTDPDVFNATMCGAKNYEIRYDDRDYQVGDLLYLRETKFTGEEMNSGDALTGLVKPLIYTERTALVQVDFILRGPRYGLCDNWVIMSTHRVKIFPTDLLDARGIE